MAVCSKAVWQPLAMALVSSGSRGNKLLFCYNGDQPIQDSEHDLLSKLPRRTLAELLAPSSVMVGRRFELRVDEWRFVGHPFSLQTVMWTASFNVVFILQADCSSDVVMAYEQLSRVLGAGLVHEEHRCGYLRGQFHQLMQVGDNLDELDTTTDKQSLEGIGLAATLFTVLNNLQAGNPHVHTYLNGWSEVSFRITTCCHGSNAAVCERGLDPQVKPYTALLLVKCVTEINHCLPSCSNPSLHRFISALSPIKNLQQVSLDADIPLHQSLQYAAHLVHWGCAMTVYPLSETNVYVTSAMADTVRGSKLYNEFNDKFDDVLPSLLEHFSTPVQLRDMIDEYSNEQLIPLVAWLLQHHQIEQLHTYIYIVKPLSQPLSRSAFSSPRPSLTPSTLSLDNDNQPVTVPSITKTDTSTSRTDASTAISRPDTGTNTSRPDTSTSLTADMLQYLTREEVDWVLDTNSSEEDLALFASLCRYFHGSHHAEEVMMMENITRSQLLTLIDKFSEILVTCSLPEH